MLYSETQHALCLCPAICCGSVYINVHPHEPGAPAGSNKQHTGFITAFCILKNVKLILFTSGRHTWGLEVQLHAFLISQLDGDEFNIRPRPLHSREIPLYLTKLGGHQNRSVRVE